MALGRYAAAAAVAALAAAPATAGAETGRLADFAARLTTTAPGTPTGMGVHLRFHRAGDPNAKPSPIRSALIRLPAGLRFDSGAVAQCTASDAQLMALGSDACPHESELTVGSFSAMTGFGPPADPVPGDDHVFNGPNQFIEVITAPGAPFSPGADRLTIDGSTLTAHPPKAAGGPPDGESAVRSIDFRIPVRTAGPRSLITTPPGCPSTGEWSSTGTFRFADGSSDTVTSLTPCRARATLPALSLSIRPRHIRADRATRVRLRVRSGASHCVGGAAIRFAGRTVRADVHGRATLAVRMRKPGIRRALATSRGCRHAVAHVRVIG